MINPKPLLILLLFIISCGKQKQSSSDEVILIDIPHKSDRAISFDKSGLTYDFEIIPLKISDNQESILSPAYSKIEYFDGYYYLGGLSIGDTPSNPKFFDKEGNFIKMIPRGKGNGEVFVSRDFCIDKQGRTLDVLDLLCIKQYDLLGNYIKKIEPVKDAVQIEKLDGVYFLYDSGIDKRSIYNLSMINENSGEIKDYIKKNSNRPTLIPHNMTSYNDKVLVYPLKGNIVYKVDKKNMEPVIYAKFTNMVSDSLVNDTNEYYGKMYTNFFNFHIIEDDKLFALDLMGEFSGRVIYDVEQNKVYDHPLQFRPKGLNDSGEFYLLFPDQLKFDDKWFKPGSEKIRDAFKDMIEKYGLDTNPYILKLNIKRK